MFVFVSVFSMFFVFLSRSFSAWEPCRDRPLIVNLRLYSDFLGAYESMPPFFNLASPFQSAPTLFLSSSIPIQTAQRCVKTYRGTPFQIASLPRPEDFFFFPTFPLPCCKVAVFPFSIFFTRFFYSNRFSPFPDPLLARDLPPHSFSF